MKPDKVALNCHILKETDEFLAQFKKAAANERNLSLVSYGWTIDELVRMVKRSTKLLQTIVVSDKVQ